MQKSTQYITARDTLDMDELIEIANTDTLSDYDLTDTLTVSDSNVVSTSFRTNDYGRMGRMPMAA